MGHAVIPRPAIELRKAADLAADASPRALVAELDHPPDHIADTAGAVSGRAPGHQNQRVALARSHATNVVTFMSRHHIIAQRGALQSAARVQTADSHGPAR